jgi:Holliday junction DNA helicase RuvA
MIARIQGRLDDLRADMALIAMQQGDGQFVYEVLLSPFTVGRLGGSIGQIVTLQTLHYMESHNQGASFIPRLAGFLTADDRAFFELFVTTKGIGNRKALRAMALATNQLAQAVVDRDVKLLQTLPEIGKRTAETLIATLSGKVDRFVGAPRATTTTATEGKRAGASAGNEPITRQVVETLVALGESRIQALQWIDEAMQSVEPDDRPNSVQDLLDLVYRMRDR